MVNMWLPVRQSNSTAALEGESPGAYITDSYLYSIFNIVYGRNESKENNVI